jgi:uncharacterized membrane protein YqaE (UPF0057 family)
MCGTDCFLMLLAVLFPPIGGKCPQLFQQLQRRSRHQRILRMRPQKSTQLTDDVVWVKKGICGADSLINIALCCLGFLPGLLHAWYIILQNPESYEQYQQVPDGERGDGRTTYYVISHEQSGHQQGQPSYGTVASQPTAGQFPGQQSGGVGSFAGQQQKNVKSAKGAAAPTPQGQAGGEGSSNQPELPPPTYADVIKGDNKVQGP